MKNNEDYFNRSDITSVWSVSVCIVAEPVSVVEFRFRSIDYDPERKKCVNMHDFPPSEEFN